MVKRLLGLFALILCVLALTGCAHAPSSGVVHDRDYRSAYDAYTPTCVSYASNGTCKLSIPHYTHYDAECYLDIYASKDDHGWVEIPCTSYEHYAVGSTYGTSNHEGSF
jgi:hypothetical protein